MKIISVTNQKGGVAKTTTVINLASSLARQNKKVLVIDLDPQGNLTSGLNRRDDFSNSIYEVLCSNLPLGQAIYKTDWKFIDLVPASIVLATAEMELHTQIGRETILREAIEKAQLSKYDYVLIDTNPSLGNLTINALASADSIIIPLEPEIYSLEGVDFLLKAINLVKSKINMNLDIEGVLLVKVHPRTKIAKEFEEEIRELFQDKVFKTKINLNVKIQEAQSERMPILYYDDKSKGAIQYLELAKELIAHEGE